MKTIEFQVRGRGRFPIDMLRYDAAHPASGLDAIKIENSFRVRGGTARTIGLRSHSAPTTDRWASFGWEVLSS